MKLEKRLQRIPFEIASATQFYESQLSDEALREIEHAKGTECYVNLLLQKYKEGFGR